MQADELKPFEQITPTQGNAKKPYAAPRLTVHGSVAELTQGGGGAHTDGLMGSTPVTSDRNLKEHVQPVDSERVLTGVAALPIATWNYVGEDAAVRHMGPMAQDFAAAFGLGADDRHIHVVDASGVALASIQALYALAQDHARQLDVLRTEVDGLRRLLGSRNSILAARR